MTNRDYDQNQMIDRIRKLEDTLAKISGWLLYEVGSDVELTPGLEDALKLIPIPGFEDYYYQDGDTEA